MKHLKRKLLATLALLFTPVIGSAQQPKTGGALEDLQRVERVLRVSSVTRLTMPFFLTFDPKYADRGLIEQAGGIAMSASGG